MEFIEVGVTATRDPRTGEFYPPVPLFIRSDDVAEKSAQGMVDAIVPLFADRFRQYVEAQNGNY